MTDHAAPGPTAPKRARKPWEPMKIVLIGNLGDIVRGTTPPISQVTGKKTPPPDSEVFMRRP